MKVITYIRVSTDKQAAEGVSLEAQKRTLNLYCQLHNLDVVSSEVDAGQSAKSLQRPGLQRALEAIEAGEADGLV